MKYLGNKNKLAKHLSPIITEHLNGENCYIEPFVGALGMMENIRYEKRFGYDIDRHIISLMKAVQTGWKPPQTVTEDEYDYIKANRDKFEDHYLGFIGFGCTFAGQWFNTFARGNSKKGEPRNYAAESARNLEKMIPRIEGVALENKDYREIDTGTGNVVYCDIPYKGTKQYKNAFDWDEFWNWARAESLKNYVYISEYTAPDDFISLWEKEHNCGVSSAANRPHNIITEKLFTYESNDSLVKSANNQRAYGSNEH